MREGARGAMSRRWMSAALGLAFVVMAAVLLSGTGDGFLAVDTAAGLAPAHPYAVIDLERAFDEYKKGIDLMAQRKKLYEKRRVKIEEAEKMLQSTKDELELLSPGSPSYEKRQNEIIEAESKIKTMRRLYTQEIQLQRDHHFETILQEIQAETEAFAISKGYDLVLQKQFRVNEEKLWRVVFYADPQLDITGAIVDLLNKRYKKP